MYQQFIDSQFKKSGITIDGDAPWDFKVKNKRCFQDIFFHQSLGLGESYMRGDWEVEALDLFIEKLFRSEVTKRRNTPSILISLIQNTLMNLQTRSRSKIVCDKHYDIGNDLYKLMLDERMNYTCAYWNNVETLEQAQERKLELICQKLNLRPGMHILDIGCGFGSFMKYAVENFDVKCTGYSLSKEQTKYGKKDTEGLPIEFVLDDYRNIKGKFDRVVSIGMLEAVGHKNFKQYFKTVDNCLKKDGIALIHTVGHNYSTTITDPWIDKYIFPNGILPSIAQIGNAIEGELVMEDWHNMGPHYVETLMEWNNRFQKNWDKIKLQGYTEDFKKMWEFYLLSFAGGFRARQWQLWQIVLTKKGRNQPNCRFT